jgi:hypothetical protein
MIHAEVLAAHRKVSNVLYFWGFHLTRHIGSTAKNDGYTREKYPLATGWIQISHLKREMHFNTRPIKKHALE